MVTADGVATAAVGVVASPACNATAVEVATADGVATAAIGVIVGVSAVKVGVDVEVGPA